MLSNKIKNILKLTGLRLSLCDDCGEITAEADSGVMADGKTLEEAVDKLTAKLPLINSAGTLEPTSIEPASIASGLSSAVVSNDEAIAAAMAIQGLAELSGNQLTYLPDGIKTQKEINEHRLDI